jgi:Protein of unknown function (DUF3667)
MAEETQPPAPTESSDAAPCPNCGAPPAGRYCTECGQRNDRLRVTARALLGDLLEAVFKFDRKVPSTARSLFIPGALTLDYLAGRRARHLRPWSLFLLCAGLNYVAWAATRSPADGPHVQLGLATARITLDPDAGSAPDGGTAPSAFEARLRQHPERISQSIEALQSPKGQLVWVAAFALALAASTRRRGLLLSEHLVFVLHVQAFSGLVSAAGRALKLPEDIAQVLGAAYDLAAFVRVYRFGWWGTTWRFAVSMALALSLVALQVVAALLAFALW